MSDFRVEKGLRGEREVHQILSSWWGGPWRVRGKHRHGTDIIAPKNFPLDIEVKNHGIAKIRWVVTCPLQLLSWWERARTTSRKPPLLCFKAQGVWLVLIRRHDLGGIRLPPTFFATRAERGERLVGCRLKDLVLANPRRPGAPRAPKRVSLPRWLTKYRVTAA